jgi:hypothetical protein
MRRLTLLSLALGLFLTGCRGSDPIAKNPPEPAPATTEPAPVGESPKPVDAPKSNETVAKVDPKPARAPWKPTAETQAVEIAKKVDAMIVSLRSVQADAQMEVTIPEGIVKVTAGAKIKDDKTFYIQYPYIPGRRPMTAVIKSNGQKVGELREGKPVEPGTTVSGTPKELGWEIAAAGKLPKNPVQVSPLRVREIPRMVFAGLADGSTPFTDFVRALEKGGFKVKVDKRVTPYEGREITNYRILGDKGNEKVEIVVDGTLYLPVTINATSDKVGSRVESLRWSTRWQNQVKFDPKEFAIDL